jgi:hypothetical protein
MKWNTERSYPHVFPPFSLIHSPLSRFPVSPFNLFPSSGRVYILTFCIYLLSIASAHAWGTLAHRVIAQVALRHLSPEAQAEITNLLGSRSIIEVATAADEWRSSRPETAPWHYVNIPFATSTYDADRDCPYGDCVIAAIARYQAILSSRSHDHAARQEALIFLVHFVADIHQPLHCINNDDRGGNDVAVSFFGFPTNLHTVWDSELLQRTHLRERAYTHRLMSWLATQNTDNLQQGTPVDWALEAHGLARHYAYQLPSDHNLRSGYYSANLPIVEAQLAKAAVRLAQVVNTAFQGRSGRNHHSNR